MRDDGRQYADVSSCLVNFCWFPTSHIKKGDLKKSSLDLRAASEMGVEGARKRLAPYVTSMITFALCYNKQAHLCILHPSATHRKGTTKLPSVVPVMDTLGVPFLFIPLFSFSSRSLPLSFLRCLFLPYELSFVFCLCS